MPGPAPGLRLIVGLHSLSAVGCLPHIQMGTGARCWLRPASCPVGLLYMNQNIIQLSRQYASALERQLKKGPRARLAPALELGRRAVALGLETLDLARIHHQAVAALELPGGQNAFTKLAGRFFSEANSAIEDTHQAARQTKAELIKLIHGKSSGCAGGFPMD